MKEHTDKIEEFQKYFKTHSKSKEYLGHTSKVHSVGWSCDGKRLASGSFDKCVCIYTLDRDRLVSPEILDYFRFTLALSLEQGNSFQRTWRLSGPTLLASDQRGPTQHCQRGQVSQTVGYSSAKVYSNHQHKGGEHQYYLVTEWKCHCCGK